METNSWNELYLVNNDVRFLFFGLIWFLLISFRASRQISFFNAFGSDRHEKQINFFLLHKKIVFRNTHSFRGQKIYLLTRRCPSGTERLVFFLTHDFPLTHTRTHSLMETFFYRRIYGQIMFCVFISIFLVAKTRSVACLHHISRFLNVLIFKLCISSDRLFISKVGKLRRSWWTPEKNLVAISLLGNIKYFQIVTLYRLDDLGLKEYGIFDQ